MTTLATGALAGAMVAWGAVSTLAGEGDGEGDATPIAGHRVASICSFSRWNDEPEGNENPIEDGRVHSFGQVVKKLGPLSGIAGLECDLNTGGAHKSS